MGEVQYLHFSNFLTANLVITILQFIDYNLQTQFPRIFKS